MIKVAVTGLNAGDSPAPGVPVVRCLREHPRWHGKIIGLAYDALESGILDPRVVDDAYMIPYPSTGSEALLERLKQVHAKEKIDVIIPNLDSELLNFIRIENELGKLGIRLYLPTDEGFKMRSKTNLPRFADEAGIQTPRTQVINGPGTIKLDQLQYPLVIKGIFYEAHIATHKDAAAQMIHKVTQTWGYPVLLQEFIQGEEFNVAALGDGNGNMIAAASMKKLVFTDKKKGWACISINNKSLLEYSKKIIRHLKWKGPIEIEAIQSKKDGHFYIIELNPRFPAWIYLAKAAGANLPYSLLQLALGEPASIPGSAKAGVVFTNYTTNLVMDLNEISDIYTNGELHYEEKLRKANAL